MIWNKTKAIRAALVAGALLLFVVLGFQNCDIADIQKQIAAGKMVLPNDINKFESVYRGFDEMSGVASAHLLSFDVAASSLHVRISSAPIQPDLNPAPNPCEGTLALTPAEKDQIKRLINGIQVCSGSGDGFMCAGSCPENSFYFYAPIFQRTLASGALKIDKQNAGEGSYFFCGGEKALNDFLRSLLVSYLPAVCHSELSRLL